MENKCYACFGQKQCKILHVKKCTSSRCSFFKTTEHHQESFKMANARLASLDKEQQKYIAQKYYKGKMPWQKGGDCHDC